MEKTLHLILEQLQQLNGSVENVEIGQNKLASRLGSIENEIKDLKDSTSRIETKQQIIYEHTARLSQYHTEVKNEIENVKDRLQFNTHKLTETELEIFKLKKQ